MSRPNRSKLEWSYIKDSLYNNCNTFTMARIYVTHSLLPGSKRNQTPTIHNYDRTTIVN